jgi:beta-glucosidase
METPFEDLGGPFPRGLARRRLGRCPVLYGTTGRSEWSSGYPAGCETTQQGWEFRPDAVGIAVRHAATVASGVPIIVTENGVATSDDTRRIAYIDGALEALHAAIDDGIDIRGYFHWTFIDNFEWTDGYSTTFGLVAVDRATFERTPRPSARHLASLARA